MHSDGGLELGAWAAELAGGGGRREKKRAEVFKSQGFRQACWKQLSL